MIRVMEMENNKSVPIRKKNRLQNYDYSSCGAYFITVCTDKRKKYFWENVGATIGRPQDVELSLYGKIVSDAIENIPLIYPTLLVERYVIMPNHIHLLLRVCSDEYGRPMVAPTMSRVVNQLKGYTVKQIGRPIWQKSFHDHIIRNQKDYEEYVNYIYYNPVRWHLDELYTEEGEE
jgi:REP element-mobilizing transposase RayT